MLIFYFLLFLVVFSPTLTEYFEDVVEQKEKCLEMHGERVYNELLVGPIN